DRSPSVLAQKLDGRSSPLPESRDSQGNRLCHQTSAGPADVAACFPSRPVRAMGNRGHGVWQWPRYAFLVGGTTASLCPRRLGQGIGLYRLEDPPGAGFGSWNRGDRLGTSCLWKRRERTPGI